jgi:hypothetical protein
VEVGQDYDLFWRLTLREVVMILKATTAKRKADFEERRALNYEMASLVAFAHHDPKAMPKYKPTGKATPENDELAQAQVRGFLMSLAMKKG